MNGNGNYKIVKKTAKTYTVKTPFYRFVFCVFYASIIAGAIYGRTTGIATDGLEYLLLIPIAAFAVFFVKGILYYTRYKIVVDEDRITYTGYFGKTACF